VKKYDNNWVTFLNYIFNPMAGFVHILPKIGLKQPSIFQSVSGQLIFDSFCPSFC